jgi:hypothetical protein
MPAAARFSALKVSGSPVQNPFRDSAFIADAGKVDANAAAKNTRATWIKAGALALLALL